jgi:hypothetical protein
MNHTPPRKRILLVALIALMTGSLTACSDAEVDYMLELVEAWAFASDIWDGQNVNYGNLAQETAGDLTDLIFGGDAQTALEGGTVVDDIRRADALAEEAMANSLDRGPETTVASLNEAMRLRPGDYTYVQMRGAIHISYGEAGLYREDQMKAQELLQDQIRNGADCKQATRSYLQHQLDALEQACPSGCDATLGEVSRLQSQLDHPETWNCS